MATQIDIEDEITRRFGVSREQMTVHWGSMNWVIEADSWMFRAPKEPAGRDRLIREWQLLETLRSLPLVPQIERVNDDLPLLRYPKLSGVCARYAKVLKSSDSAQEEFGKAIGRFLSRLHGVDITSLPEWVPSVNGYVEHIHSKLDLFDKYGARARAEQAFMDLKKVQEAGKISSRVLLHQDLHGGNMLLDEKSGLLTGVVDFGNASLGDRHFDFRFLDRFGEVVYRVAVAEYRERTGAAVDGEVVAVLARLQHANKFVVNGGIETDLRPFLEYSPPTWLAT